MSTPTTVTFRCPRCGTEHELDARWAPWCDRCKWGAAPEEDEQLSRRALRRRDRLAARATREHERLISLGLEDGPGTDRTLVLVLCTIVHLVDVAVVLGLLSVWLIPTLLPIQLVVTVLALGFAYLMAPRRHKDQPRGLPLDRERAPELWRLVDEVGAALHTAAPGRIELVTDVNAAWGVVRGGRRVLWLGYPLWAVLERQEKVALLGHELGHEINGDLTRGAYVGAALSALDEWQLLLLTADQPVGTRYGLGATAANGGQLFLSAILFPLTLVLRFLTTRLSSLAARSRQYAEHLADAHGARLAGTDSAVSLEREMLDPSTLEFAVESGLRRDADACPWDLIKAYRRDMPEQEVARQLVMSRKTLASVDSTHPPTYRRMELLSRPPHHAATLVLTAEREAAVDAEIRACEQWVKDRYAGRRRDGEARER